MKTFGDLCVVIFVVSSLFSVGLNLTWQQIVSPLRQIRLIAISLIVNFVVVPILTVVVTRVMSLSEPQAVGLILLGSAAGAPFLPKLIEVTKGDVALSVALMVLLMVVSLVYLPLVLPFLLAGVSVNSLKIAQSLLITMILPLVAGLVVNAWRPLWAARLCSPLNLLSLVCLVVALVVISAHNFSGLWQLVITRAIPACAILLILSFGAGFAFGGRPGSLRRVLGFGTSARNIPAALIIGGQNFEHPDVVLMIVLSALIAVVVLVPAAIAFGGSSIHAEKILNLSRSEVP